MLPIVFSLQDECCNIVFVVERIAGFAYQAYRPRQERRGKGGVMRICFVLTGLLGVATLILSYSSSQALSVPSITCEDEFVKLFSQADTKECIFTIDDNYVLQAIYYETTSLAEVRIVPRYFFHDTHPGWIEPDEPVVMTSGTYRSLLARIQTVKSLGRLLKEGDVGITLNLRTSFRDVYEDGIVEREMFRNSPDKPYDVASFRALYFRNISGKLESVEAAGIQMPEPSHRIKINGEWYWTLDHSTKASVPGQVINILAAGPIGDLKVQHQ